MEGASKRTLLISYSNKPPAYRDAGGSSLLVTCLLLGQLVRDITAVFLSLTNCRLQKVYSPSFFSQNGAALFDLGEKPTPFMDTLVGLK
jgi:hypothetical protein